MTEAYSYSVGGPPLPANVTNFIVNQVGSNVLMSWDNLDDPGTEGFDIYYGPQGFDITYATLITEVTRATEMTTAQVPPGVYTFWIQARDIAGQPSATPTSFNFTVVNYNTVLSQNIYVPCYYDNMLQGGFALIRHWTGPIVPMGNELSSNYSALSPPDQTLLELNYVSGGTFGDTTYYFQMTFVTASGETLPSTEISLFVPAGNLPTAYFPVDSFPSASIDGWNIYVSTTSTTETKQNTATLSVVPPPNPTNIVNPVDQIWQMPTSGLIAGAALPTINTTGWEVFNVFVPDPYGFPSFFIDPGATDPYDDIDTGVQGSKRVWITLQLVPGPGQGAPESGSIILSQPVNKMIETYASGSSSPPFNINAYTNYFTIGLISDRYLRPGFEFIPKAGNVFYISQYEVTVDNAPATSAINGVSISSAGTTINFSTYGLSYHEPPNVQVTPSSGTAIGGNAGPVTSSNALINIYSSTGAVAGLANLAVTGV